MHLKNMHLKDGFPRLETLYYCCVLNADCDWDFALDGPVTVKIKNPQLRETFQYCWNDLVDDPKMFINFKYAECVSISTENFEKFIKNPAPLSLVHKHQVRNIQDWILYREQVQKAVYFLSSRRVIQAIEEVRYDVSLLFDKAKDAEGLKELMSLEVDKRLPEKQRNRSVLMSPVLYRVFKCSAKVLAFSAEPIFAATSVLDASAKTENQTEHGCCYRFWCCCFTNSSNADARAVKNTVNPNNYQSPTGQSMGHFSPRSGDQ